MRLTILIPALVLVCVAGANAQNPVETSATTNDVRINDDKKIKTSVVEARTREHKGKTIRKGRPDTKRHKSHSESGVFKRHNHFKSPSVKVRHRASRKTAPSAK